MAIAPRGDHQHSDLEEWSRLQTSLHTREAIRALRAAAASIADAASSAHRPSGDLDRALVAVQDAALALGRVDAAVHAEGAVTHRHR